MKCKQLSYVMAVTSVLVQLNAIHLYSFFVDSTVINISGIESRWGRDFPPVQTGPGAHPASCKMGTGSLSGVKCGRGVLLTTHPLLVPRSWKSRAIPLPTLWATPGLLRDHFTSLMQTNYYNIFK